MLGSNAFSVSFLLVDFRLCSPLFFNHQNRTLKIPMKALFKQPIKSVSRVVFNLILGSKCLVSGSCFIFLGGSYLIEGGNNLNHEVWKFVCRMGCQLKN